MHKNNTLAKQIIQTLFFFGESTNISEIAKFLNIKKEEVLSSIETVEELLEIIDFRLIKSENNLDIALSSEISKIIHKNKISEIKEDLSESSLEVMSIVLYKQKATKAEIDFIRGVDSARSIRTLLVRGLLEKQSLKNKSIYSPSTETLKYLNINKQSDLEEFAEINEKLTNLIQGKDAE